MQQSDQDLIRHLKEQLEFIRASSVSYDAGFIGEAKRLSTTIATIVHDTRSSTSLLSQLGKKNILFYDTGTRYDEALKQMNDHLEKVNSENKSKGKITKGVFFSQRLLLMATFGKSGKVSGPWAPLLEIGLKGSKLLPFDDWWDQNVISDIQQTSLSRKELVLSVRNQDGGAHIDPKLDEKYADITRTKSAKIKIFKGSEMINEQGPEHGTVRQIAFELEHSIQNQLGGILN